MRANVCLVLPWVRVDLAEFFLMDGHGLACFVEDEEPRAGGPLIYTADELLVGRSHRE